MADIAQRDEMVSANNISMFLAEVSIQSVDDVGNETLNDDIPGEHVRMLASTFQQKTNAVTSSKTDHVAKNNESLQKQTTFPAPESAASFTEDSTELPSVLVQKYSEEAESSRAFGDSKQQPVVHAQISEKDAIETLTPSVAAFFNDDVVEAVASSGLVDTTNTEQKDKNSTSQLDSDNYPVAIQQPGAAEAVVDSSLVILELTDSARPDLADAAVSKAEQKTTIPTFTTQNNDVDGNQTSHAYVTLRAPSSDQMLMRCTVTPVAAMQQKQQQKSKYLSASPGDSILHETTAHADGDTAGSEQSVAKNEETVFANDAAEQIAQPATIIDATAEADDIVLSEAHVENAQISLSAQRDHVTRPSDASTTNNYEAYFDDDFDSGAELLDATKISEHAPLPALQTPNVQNFLHGHKRFDSASQYSVASTSASTKQQQLTLANLTPAQTASIFAHISHHTNLRHVPSIHQRHVTTQDDVKFRALVCYFNHEPFRALYYMIQQNFLLGTAQYICEQFLFPNADVAQTTRSGGVCLSRQRLGELLCSHKYQASHALLDHWLRMHDFKGHSVDTALRVVLRAFVLPCDACDRAHLCRMFSRRYTECHTADEIAVDEENEANSRRQKNPQSFENSVDQNRLLCSAILLLNSDLHRQNSAESSGKSDSAPVHPIDSQKKRKSKTSKISCEAFEVNLRTAFATPTDNNILDGHFRTVDAEEISSLMLSTSGADDGPCPYTNRELERIYESIRLSPLQPEPDHTSTLSDLNDMFASSRSSRRQIPQRFVNNPQRWLVACYYGVTEFKPTKRALRQHTRRSSHYRQHERRNTSYHQQHERGSILRMMMLSLLSVGRRSPAKSSAPNSTNNNNKLSSFHPASSAYAGGKAASLHECKMKDRVLVLLNDMVLVARETRTASFKRRFLHNGMQAKTRWGAPCGLRLCRALPLHATSDVRCLLLRDNVANNVAVLKPTPATDDDVGAGGVCRFTHPSTVLLEGMCDQIKQAINVNAEYSRLRPILDKTPVLTKLPMLPDKAFVPGDLQEALFDNIEQR